MTQENRKVALLGSHLTVIENSSLEPRSGDRVVF